VDLDGATDIYRVHGWNYIGKNDPVFESGLETCLDMLGQYAVRATLFVIADSLEDPAKRRLLDEAVRRGHEVASHSMTHPLLVPLKTEEKRREIADSRKKIEDALGVPVRGFRAPGYSIDRESLEMLAESGYGYDSSVFPTAEFARWTGVALERLLWPHRPIPKSSLVELPLPDHRPSPVPFSPSYAHLLGMGYFRWGAARLLRRGAAMILLFHLIDFSEPLPLTVTGSWKARLFTLSTKSAQKKLALCRAMLDMVRDNFQLTETLKLIAQCDGVGGAEVR